MRHKVHKLFWVWDFEKEEKWLNEMSAKGFALIAVGLCTYYFDTCEPGEYNIRMELLEKSPKNPESIQYLEFIEDTDTQYLGNIKRWAFFRRKSALGKFDIFSDIDSRIRQLTRIMIFIIPLMLLNLFAVITNLVVFFSLDGLAANLIASMVNALIAVFCLIGCLRINSQRNKLKKDRFLQE